MTFFLEKSFKTDDAYNGKDAQLLIYKNKYQVVILDLDIQNHSSFEVLRYIKLNSPDIKIIVTVKDALRITEIGITEFELKKLGASELLTKPFLPEFLLKTIENNYQIESWRDIKSNTDSKEAEEVKAGDEEFTRIKFENFFSGTTTIYDHYIRLGKNKFVKILHEGESFDSSRLAKYRDADLDYLYFKTTDRLTYINFTNELLKKIIGKKSTTIEKKVKFTQSVVDKYLEQVFSSGLRPSLVDEGKKVCENMYHLIEREPELNKFMKTYEEFNSMAYGHLFLVSFFSIITCKNMDWASSRTIEVVALGGLLHDIGKLKLPPSMRDKRPAQMNDDERKLYESHPKLGATMLNNFPSIPESVKQIVYQHHEWADGKGFPNNLNSIKIYPPAKIVILNNEYTTFITDKKLAPLAGLKEFIKDKSLLPKFDPTTMKALISGFMKDK